MPDPFSTDAVPFQDAAAGHALTVDETSAFTPTHAGVPVLSVSPGDPLIGTIIGRYTLLKKLGEGGMGSVYLADQSEPVKRQVALKLIRGNVDTRTILARFEAERQALAVMDHPNIARIYDGGIDVPIPTDGAEGDTFRVIHQTAPYFVMELVHGVPITDYCDQHRLSPRQRLELFVPICQAVQHAHQKGIIHRDLKPSNVLVTEVDGKPVPKIIDFGVAKATEQPLTDQSLGDTGAIVGTPTYMSPEQADPGSMDIDTRTDIYALGVMLYELLTGSTPIDARQFRRGAIVEMLRMVREIEPPRPSTKLSTAEALPSIAANRNIEPKQLQAMLRGDVDWIVMKALEKDRTRRYETANGFAADVQRYLTGEAVLAHPPGRWYLAKKFVRRNRVQVIAAGLVVGALVAGIVGTSWGMFEANLAWKAESERAKSERLAKLAAQSAEDLTAQRLKQIELINNSVFDIFTEFDVRKPKADKEPVEAMLAKKLIESGKKLDEKAIADPLVLASLRNRLGQTLLNLGEFEASIALFVKSRETRAAILGADHPDTLTSMNNLGEGYSQTGKLDQALSLYEVTLRLRKAKLGTDHPDTLISMGNLAYIYHQSGKLDHALPLLEETHELMKAILGADHTDTLTNMNNLARAYHDARKLDKALPLLEETLKQRKATLGADHPAILTSMNNLAYGYRDAGKLDKALPLFEETLKLTKAKLGADHPDTLGSMSNLSAVYYNAGKLDKALPLVEAAFKLMKAKLGADHPDTLTTMSNLAEGYQATGKLDLALPIFEETLNRRKAKLGVDHPDTLRSMNNLANGYHDAGKLDLALVLLEESLKLRKVKLRTDHPDFLANLHNLAVGYWEAKRFDRSVPLFEELLSLQQKKLGRSHPETLKTVGDLGVNYKNAGRLVESIPLIEEAHRVAIKYPQLRVYGSELLDAYVIAGKASEAVKLCAELLDYARKELPKESPQLAGQFAQLGVSMLQCKAYAEAEPLLRECLTIREKMQPDVWSTFNTKSMLGGALLGQKKYASAEPLLLKGLEGMKAREKTIPPQASTRLPEALDRLMQFYTETNKPDEVKKWHAERANLPKPVEKK